MKTTDIKIGKTYRNKGAGTTTRTVLEIDGADVKYLTYVTWLKENREYALSLKSFAQWAGSEVS